MLARYQNVGQISKYQTGMPYIIMLASQGRLTWGDNLFQTGVQETSKFRGTHTYI